MNDLKIIYVVYAIIALLCIVPEVIGFIGLAEQNFESGTQYSGLHTRFKINLGFILFGFIIQVSILASFLSSRKAR